MPGGIPQVTSLTCARCGHAYPAVAGRYVCDRCGPRGVLRVSYRPEADTAFRRRVVDGGSAAPRGQWRFLPLLPVDPEPLPPLVVGDTPLYPAPRLGEVVGLSRLLIKDETRQPTASLKDRASAVAVAQALSRGAPVAATASTGNAAASLAALCAASDLPCVVFVPVDAPRAKVAQIVAFGATALLVRGGYDRAVELCEAACPRFGWYNRNTGYNPYMVEGKKTVAFEIAEALGWRAPDVVVVPAGDGCIISGVWKGFTDLRRAGLIDRLPRLVAAQAAGSDAIARALERGTEPEPIVPDTIADSIAVGLPRNGVMAVQDIRASGGGAIRVTDAEILGSISRLGRTTGVFAEPAAAAAIAALPKLRAALELDAEATVVALVTGSGLKDVAAAERSTPEAGGAIEIEPDLDAVARAVGPLLA